KAEEEKGVLAGEQPAVRDQRGVEAAEKEDRLVGLAVGQTTPELSASEIGQARHDGVGRDCGVAEFEGLKQVHGKERRGDVHGKVPGDSEQEKAAEVGITKRQEKALIKGVPVIALLKRPLVNAGLNQQVDHSPATPGEEQHSQRLH